MDWFNQLLQLARAIKVYVEFSVYYGFNWISLLIY